jgi:rhamnose transport system substrate-binding protein
MTARSDSPAVPRWAILPALLLIELAVFSAISTNFLTARNALDVSRLAVEIGLLATAMTAVILTGGIDLSVGSTLGLSGIVVGGLWQEYHVPLWIAAFAGVGTGVLCGAVNAVVITRLRVPPLIVTLATFSLFRGITEGITGGSKNYHGFPAWFLFLGSGQIAGVPAQVVVFVIFAAIVGLVVHRTIPGREWTVIGFTPEGARYAAIPVNRRVASVYLLAGAAAGLAGVIYAAHWNQAKADAGTGYELKAITAVVLGGTSIFGGRGSVPGTLAGLAVITVLTNGLGLAGQPGELAEVLTGGLLLAATGLDQWVGRTRRPVTVQISTEEPDVRNSQVAAICCTILIAAALVVGGNAWLVRSINGRTGGGGAGPAGKKLVIAMMPKNKGNSYFVSCKKGAEEAADEIGATLIWDGPTDSDSAKQNEIVERWITRKVDVIAVAAANAESLAPVLKKAMDAGIHVITFDADVLSSAADARDFFINACTPEGIADTLTDDAAKQMDSAGDFAIVSGFSSASNSNKWIELIKARVAEKYPKMRIVTVQYCDDQQPKAAEETRAVMSTYPAVKVVMAISSEAMPGAGEAILQSGRTDVHVIGLGLPNANKIYVAKGVTSAVVLWSTNDLGYLTVEACKDVCDGSLKPGVTSIPAGRMGSVQVKGDQVMLGKPVTFTKDNIGQYDF